MNQNPPNYGCSFMDPQIFNQGLSVMAVSAYILITALLNDGVRPAMSAITPRWNASPGDLDQALAELAAFHIVERHPGDSEDDPLHLVNPASLWGFPQPWPDPKPLPVFKKDA